MEARVTQPRGALPIRSNKVAQRRQRMREELVRAGTKLFAANGTAAVSVEDIIAEAGISRATFYGVFANKHELLGAILSPVLAGGIAGFRALDQAPPAEIVPGIIRVYTDLWATGERALTLIAGIDQSVFGYLGDSHEAFTASLRGLLLEAGAAGCLRNGDAELSFRVIARTAVPLLRVFADRPDWAALFRDAMTSLLLQPDRSSNDRRP